jgi:hypothetical protein
VRLESGFATVGTTDVGTAGVVQDGRGAVGGPPGHPL